MLGGFANLARRRLIVAAGAAGDTAPGQNQPLLLAGRPWLACRPLVNSSYPT